MMTDKQETAPVIVALYNEGTPRQGFDWINGWREAMAFMADLYVARVCEEQEVASVRMFRSRST